MPLILDGMATKVSSTVELPETASRFYLEIDHDYISAYDLEEGSTLTGSILEIGENEYGDHLEELEGSEIVFEYTGWAGRVFVSKPSFEALREWGLVKEFWVEVRITSAERDGEEIELCPKRDVPA